MLIKSDYDQGTLDGLKAVKNFVDKNEMDIESLKVCLREVIKKKEFDIKEQRKGNFFKLLILLTSFLALIIDLK